MHGQSGDRLYNVTSVFGSGDMTSGIYGKREREKKMHKNIGR